jgi:hypothetical protein
MGSSSRYAQVARTYVHRWPLWLIAAVLVAYFYLLYGGAFRISMKSERLTFLACLMWITAWASGTVAAHVKQQFTDASAALVPGYRTPHLLIGAIAMLLVAAILPALAAPALTFSTPAVVGMALIVAGSTAWFMQVQNFTAGIVCNLLWLSLLNRRVVFALGAMLEWKNEVLAAALVALGLAALIALWMRLARMHEGMREYGRRSLSVALVGPGNANPAAVRSTDTWFESMLRRPVHTQCIAAANLWNRVRHLRATGLGRWPWLMGALMAGSMIAIPWFTGGPNNPAIGALESFILVAMILPAVSTIGHWGRRCAALGYESLRPASRPRFVREIGLAIALDLAEAWVAVTSAALFAVWVWDPQAAVELVTGGFLLLAAATCLVVFGVNWWVLRLRNSALTAVVMVLTGLAPIAPLLGKRLYAGTGWTSPLALGLLVIGALVTLDAYGRWCGADLE